MAKQPESTANGNFDEDRAWADAQAAENHYGQDPKQWLSQTVADIEETIGEPPSSETPGDESPSTPTKVDRARDSAGRFVAKGQEESPDAPSPEEPEDPASELDPNVVDMARRVYDLSDEDLAEFTTTQELERALRFIDRRGAFTQQATASSQADQPAQPPPPIAPPAANGQPGQAVESADSDPFAGVDLSTLDEDDPLRKTVETLISEVKTLRQSDHAKTAYIQQQQHAEGQRIVKHFVENASKMLGEIDANFYGAHGKRSGEQQKLVDAAVAQAAQLVLARTQQGENYFDLDLNPFVRAGSFSLHWEKLQKPTNGKHPQADRIRERSRARSGVAGRSALPERTSRPKNPDDWLNARSEDLETVVDEVYETVRSR